jgi:hypothetical protein
MKLNDKNSMKSILNQVIWGPVVDIKPTDEMILKYGLSKSNTYDLGTRIKNQLEAAREMEELRELEEMNCVEHETAYSEECGEIEIIPMGLIIQ